VPIIARFAAQPSPLGLAVAVVLVAVAERLAGPLAPVARPRRRSHSPILSTPFLIAARALGPAAVAACLPTLTFRGAGALRGHARPGTGVPAAFVVEAGLVASWVAVVPWLAALALAAAPLAWRAAADRERRQRVSRWDELHHRAAGDPLSWDAR